MPPPPSYTYPPWSPHTHTHHGPPIHIPTMVPPYTYTYPPYRHHRLYAAVRRPALQRRHQVRPLARLEMPPPPRYRLTSRPLTPPTPATKSMLSSSPTSRILAPKRFPRRDPVRPRPPPGPKGHSSPLLAPCPIPFGPYVTPFMTPFMSAPFRPDGPPFHLFSSVSYRFLTPFSPPFSPSFSPIFNPFSPLFHPLFHPPFPSLSSLSYPFFTPLFIPF